LPSVEKSGLCFMTSSHGGRRGEEGFHRPGRPSPVWKRNARARAVREGDGGPRLEARPAASWWSVLYFAAGASVRMYFTIAAISSAFSLSL